MLLSANANVGVKTRRWARKGDDRGAACVKNGAQGLSERIHEGYAGGDGAQTENVS